MHASRPEHLVGPRRYRAVPQPVTRSGVRGDPEACQGSYQARGGPGGIEENSGLIKGRSSRHTRNLTSRAQLTAPMIVIYIDPLAAGCNARGVGAPTRRPVVGQQGHRRDVGCGSASPGAGAGTPPGD